MSVRWALVTAAIAITVSVIVWDRCAILWAGPSETISWRVNALCHQHPEIAFAMGATLVYCGTMPLLPRRRRWIATFMVFMLLMAVVAGHCIWPVQGWGPQ